MLAPLLHLCTPYVEPPVDLYKIFLTQTFEDDNDSQ